MSQVRAVYSGFVGWHGVPVLVHEGEVREADDDFVKAYPQHFKPIPDAPAARGRRQRSDG